MQEPLPPLAWDRPPSTESSSLSRHSRTDEVQDPFTKSSPQSRNVLKKLRKPQDFTTRVNVVKALNLPDKAQQLCLSQREQRLIGQLKCLLAQGPEAFTELAAILQDQLAPGRFLKMVSRSSSVYSSRRGSRIDLKEALRELDLYYWKTHQDFLQDYNNVRPQNNNSLAVPYLDDSALEQPRGRSAKSPLREALTFKASTDASAEQSPAIPADIAVTPPSPPPRSALRSKSWGPARKSIAKPSRQPSPAPSIKGPSEYIYSEDARAKLKMYLTTPDKFEEALEYGFPSVLPTPEMRESPVVPPPAPSTRGCNPALDVQRFMRNDVISWLESEASKSSRESVQQRDELEHIDFPELRESPESESEKEVVELARELAVQNAVPMTVQPKSEKREAPISHDEAHYDRDFDISDYENAIDDSQDDRGTASPVSPVTPTTPDIIPLPLVTNASKVSRRTHSEHLPHREVPVRPARSSSDQTGLKRSASYSHREVQPPPSFSTMIRTAPALPPQPEIQRVHHFTHSSIGSISSLERSSITTVSPRSSTGSNRPHSAHSISPVEPLHGPIIPYDAIPARTTSRANPVAHSRSQANTAKSRTRHRNLRDSMVKPLPLRPYENAVTTSIATSPVTSPVRSSRKSVAAKHHRAVSKKFSYDSPAAYMAPRSPPAAPLALDSGPRQMTLRMTLTRPELRAPDEEIYGGAAPAPVVQHDALRRSRAAAAAAATSTASTTNPVSSTNRASTLSKHPSLRSSTLSKQPSLRTTTKRRSEIQVLPSGSELTDIQPTRTKSTRTLNHPDLPAHTVMREKTVRRVEREPNKLRKARTDPALQAMGGNGSGGDASGGEDAFGTVGALRTLSGGQAPLAQLGSDGEWRLISPSVAAAGGVGGIGSGWKEGKDEGLYGEKRKSLWKKMSLSGMRKGPSVVLP